jgi:hypothetical protein
MQKFLYCTLLKLNIFKFGRHKFNYSTCIPREAARIVARRPHSRHPVGTLADHAVLHGRRRLESGVKAQIALDGLRVVLQAHHANDLARLDAGAAARLRAIRPRSRQPLELQVFL